MKKPSKVIKFPVKSSVTSTSCVFEENICHEEIDVDGIKLNKETYMDLTYEFKTPINTIFGAAQLVETYIKEIDNEARDEFSKNINYIKQNSYRLMKKINDLEDLMKIDAGLYNLSYSLVNVVEVVESVVDYVSEIVEKNYLKIIFNTTKEESLMFIDVETIQRVLLNLLSNAVKFSKPNGRIYVGLAIKENSVKITVIDNGIGMEKDHIRNVFNKFDSLDKFLIRILSGKGMGLILSKKLVEINGGSLNIITRPNKGSAFIINLPNGKLDSVYSIYNNKIDLDNLKEMVKTEFSCVDCTSI